MLNPHCVLISFYSLSIEHFSLSIMHPHITTIFTIFFLFIFFWHIIRSGRGHAYIHALQKNRRNCSPTYSSSSLSTCYGNIITTDFFSASSTGKGEMLMMMMMIIVSLVEWQRRSLSLFSFFLVVIAVQYCYQYIVDIHESLLNVKTFFF